MHSWMLSDWRYRRAFAKRHLFLGDRFEAMPDDEWQPIREVIDATAAGDVSSREVSPTGSRHLFAVYKSTLDGVVPQPSVCCIFDITIGELRRCRDVGKTIHSRLKARKDYKWATAAIREECMRYRLYPTSCCASQEQLLTGPPGTCPVLLWIIDDVAK